MKSKETNILYTDENIIRIIAAEVSLLALTALLSDWTFPLFLLAADYGLRAFTPQLSPLAGIAILITEAAGRKARPVFAPAQKFAAKLGWLLALGAFLFSVFKIPAATLFSAGILLVCTFLEAAFNLCIGCYVYHRALMLRPLLYKKTKNIHSGHYKTSKTNEPR